MTASEEYNKEDNLPVATWCQKCDKSYPLETETCPKCGRELEVV